MNRDDRSAGSAEAERVRVRDRSSEGVTRADPVRALPDDRTRPSRRRPAAGNAAGDRTGPRAVPGGKVAAVTYRVVLERDESGAWIARIPSVPGCHSHGRSLVEARRRVREALSLWVEDSDSAELVDDVRLPRDALAAVRRSSRSRARLAEVRSEASTATADAVTRLVDDLGLGVRDAAYLLGVSFQRVQQVAEIPRS